MEKEASKNSADFISYLAHELRTPLSSMRWYTEMLLDGSAGSINDDQKKFLTEVYNGNKRIGDMLTKSLEIIHTENGKYVLNLEEVNISEISKNIIFKNDDIVKSKKLIINSSFFSETENIKFDKKSLEIILEALLSNAIKYNKENGVVDLKIEKNNDFIIVTIKDEGLGILDVDKEKVGKEMFRGSNVKNLTPGTGLSLLLVKKILDITSGELTFESEENAGTKFELVLYLR